MIDLGISKLALIGVVALVVIGPEKLPGMARTFGALLGRAQRYVADVKAEVNRTIELDELKKMKESMETAARDVQQQVNDTADDFEKSWADATRELESAAQAATRTDYSDLASIGSPAHTAYKPVKKNWRKRQSAVPHWYKARNGVRTRALSGAARVARYRPKNRTV